MNRPVETVKEDLFFTVKKSIGLIANHPLAASIQVKSQEETHSSAQSNAKEN